MNKKQAIELLKKAREASKKRNFTQSFDLVINLKDLDLKNSSNHVDFFATLHYSKGKKVKVCGLVGPELKDDAADSCDFSITAADFDKYTGKKKEIKRLAEEYDYFIAQANIMPKIAQIFGTVLGPKGKMPNPKSGCVVPPKANLKPLIEKLQKTVRVKAKTQKLIQVPVGNEEMGEEEVADNLSTLYEQIIHHLPNEKHNIKDAFVKTTMGKPIKVE